MPKTKMKVGQEDKIVKIQEKEVIIKANEYFVLDDKCIIRNFKLNELALKFDINIEDVKYEVADLTDKHFEYICKVTVRVGDKIIIGIGEANEFNISTEISRSYRGTMASVRGEGRAIVKALKYLGLEGDFYSESEFEISLFNDNQYLNETKKTKETNEIKETEKPINEYTLEEILNYKLEFGQCKGMTISEVREQRVGMFKWILESHNKQAGKQKLIVKSRLLCERLIQLEEEKKKNLLEEKS